jgi:hypothetical protein
MNFSIALTATSKWGQANTALFFSSPLSNNGAICLLDFSGTGFSLWGLCISHV